MLYYTSKYENVMKWISFLRNHQVPKFYFYILNYNMWRHIEYTITSVSIASMFHKIVMKCIITRKGYYFPGWNQTHKCNISAGCYKAFLHDHQAQSISRHTCKSRSNLPLDSENSPRSGFQPLALHLRCSLCCCSLQHKLSFIQPASHLCLLN